VITVGIVSQLPATVSNIINSVFADNPTWRLLGIDLPVNREATIIALGILLGVIITTALVVKLNEATRNVTIHYAKRIQGNRAYGGVKTVLPIKLITAGVIPIIFALAFLSVPSFIGQLLSGSSNPQWAELGTNLMTWFQPPTAQSFAAGGWQPYLYPAVYFFFVFIFTFFYTSITFSSQEIAENLQKQGGFIEGVRSGKQTEKYLSKLVNRLTLFGAFSLGLLAVVPIIIQGFVNTNIALQGTSILILVAVALETLRQIESRALMVTYDQYEQPDFFYETEEIKGKKQRRMRFLTVRDRKN
jgi:preprotein translocase subunit SecY